MSTGKTYSTKYLLDSNNNRGAEGQVLSTTSTGIDWVDANTVPGTGLWLENGDDIYNSNSGDIGIGTTSPAYKLDVGGSANNADIGIRVNNTFDDNDAASNPTSVVFLNAASNNGYLRVHGAPANTAAKHQIDLGSTATTSFLTFSPSGSEKMRLTSGGNLGIGTGADVYGDLHLQGGQQDIVLTNNSADGVANLTISRIIGQARGYSNNGSAMQSIDFVTNQTTWYKGDIVFKTNNTDGTDISVAATEKMRIASNGNVGIGFTSPDSTPLSTTKLSVNGNTYVAGTLGVGTTDPATVVDITKITPQTVAFTPYLQLSQRGTVANSKTGISFRNTQYDWDMGKIVTERQGSTNSFDMVFYTANTGTYGEGLRIDHTGNIGIGTSTPNAKLDIQGSQGQLFSVTDDLSGEIFAVADISGVPIMTVNSSGASYFDGNVGIGTTSTTVKLDVNGGARFNTSTGADPVYITRSGSNDQALKIYVDDAAAIFESIQDESADNYGAFQFVMDAGVTEPYFDVRKGPALANTLFRVDGNGKVGIGTTSPDQLLSVAGVISSDSNTDYYGAWMSGNSASGQDSYFAAGTWYNNAGYFKFIQSGSPHRLSIYTYNTGDHLTLQESGGNVGIGTTSPSYLLDVRDGTLSGAIARFSSINAHVIIESQTAGPAVLHLKPNTTGNKSGQFKVTTGQGYNFRWSNDAASTAEVSYMKLDTSTTGGGDLTVKGDVIAYGAPSDRKYKENIKPIESALDKAMQLQGVTFDWKESDSILDIKEDIGFIAQDVEKVLPELVRDNGKGNLSLRYQGITPILLEAIKELKAEIDLLKSKPCNCNKCNCNI